MKPQKKFSELVKELEAIVTKLEGGKIDDLDEVVAEYEKAYALAEELKVRIEEAEVKVEKIKASGEGDGDEE